ncbi:FAD-dependent oxidoreductase [Ramlibacter ginsenosidimutans]|uniref:FAD-dependent oxidoreductase n=1 Tax=Ramlibacter ginsenosidimutans TaxID=502333 RepID=A0A934TPB6_9BURK|nr:FAD-dependent oxidoreductase [Ramlibacter ginsenosidimutans]MBK6004914.1 FAD-dependent oxidoreductase [Ramlibacter ginsenosidimutans]
MADVTPLTTQCCIAGGGPAGLMLGFLLARAGVDVIVLEKHKDFLRDFRGDTIHPSTLTILQDLGLLEEFLKLPHDEISELSGDVYGTVVTLADFRHVPAPRPFLVLVPQWDFLDFIADHARRLPRFHLLMETKAERVVEENGRIVGVEVSQGERRFRIACDLLVAADGRHTTIRESAGLQVNDIGAPIDVLWFRVPRDAERHPSRTGGILRPGAMLVMLDRSSYWQCAFVIPKGSMDKLQAEGLQRFRERIAAVAPFLTPELQALASWDDIKLLGVQITDLPHWSRPGLLCIGDAAHAMSPVGGVGINLAIQDAVAAANLLADPLREGRLTTHDLERVQKRRRWAARVTQRAQVAVQDEVLSPVLARQDAPQAPPLAVRMLQRFPRLRRLPARLVGIGVRPERVETGPAHG